jgi:hypothetical protein
MLYGRPFARWSIVALGGALFAAAFMIACGDGGDDEPSATTTAESSTSAGTPGTVQVRQNDPDIAPVLSPPVSQFSILVQDLGIENFLTDLSNTAELTPQLFAETAAFSDRESGLESLTAWGYIEGYRTGLVPEGGTDAMLNGAYVVGQQVHLFEDEEGAKELYAYFVENVANNGISSPLTADTIGSESSVSRTMAGKVGGDSHVDQVLHQLILRRGNVVVVLLTIGAGPLMKVDTVLELGAIVDDKLLDQRDHPQPTPLPSRTVAASPAP